MVGTLGCINLNFDDTSIELNINYEFKESKESKSFIIKRNKNNKFLKDKLFYEDNRYFILTDGIILNCKELLVINKRKNLNDLIVYLYENTGEDFFKCFRGSFNGVFIDKLKKKAMIYTDQVGDKKIYYMLNKQNIIFSSKMKFLIDALKLNEIKCDYNELSSYCMMTYGFMLEDISPVKDVKRLMPGQYILIENGKSVLRYYHKFTNNIQNISEDDAINKIDDLFKKAIKQQFDKDKEYGYKHIASMSGGLDSRMTNIVANELGYKNVLNYTFSKNNYDDDKISKKISQDLNNEYIFKSLDDTKFLRDLEGIIQINGGTSIYYGMAHSKNMLDSINMDNYGMIHTGQIGDVVIGSFINSENENEIDITKGAYSTKLSRELNKLRNKVNYNNQEMFMIYTRGFNGALSGNYAFQELTESYSPFYNVEFMEFCLSLPLEYRKNHYIYYKWILNKHPRAGKYYYEKIHGKIYQNKKVLFIKRLPILMLNKISERIFSKGIIGVNSPRGMNPFNYWYRTNVEFKEFIDNYFVENIKYVKDEKVNAVCCDLFNKATVVTEKFQVLTVIATNKMIYSNLEK